MASLTYQYSMCTLTQLMGSLFVTQLSVKVAIVRTLGQEEKPTQKD